MSGQRYVLTASSLPLEYEAELSYRWRDSKDNSSNVQDEVYSLYLLSYPGYI